MPNFLADMMQSGDTGGGRNYLQDYETPYVPTYAVSSANYLKDLVDRADQANSSLDAETVQANPLFGFSPSDIGVLGMYMGKGARGFANALKEGRTFKGKYDQMPRFEIDDSLIKLNPDALAKDLDHPFVYTAKLGDVLDHKELFDNYPFLKEYMLEVNPNISDLGRYYNGVIQLRGHQSSPKLDALNNTKQNWKKWAKEDFEEGSFPTLEDAMSWHKQQLDEDIADYANVFNDESRETLLHEIQHAIQEKEKFARGGSPAEMRNEYGKLLARLRFVEGEPDFFKGMDEIDSVWSKVADGSLSEEEADILEAQIRQDNPYLNESGEILKKLRTYGDEYGDKAYRRLAGEIEARDTAARRNMSMADRMQTAPYSSENIPVENALVRYR